MTELDRWLDRLALRHRRQPMLEESLLGGRFWAYAAHRLRFLGLARLLALAVHLVELVFVVRSVGPGQAGISLLVQNGCVVLGGFWWGALELMRTRLRDMPVDARATREIGRWLGRAACLAGLCLLVPVAVLAGRWVAAGAGPSILDGYVLVVCARLGVDVVVRTVYSGVYARRRVYRPLGAIVAVETAGLVATLALWWVAGAWSVPLGLAVSVAVSRGIVLVYTLRAYDAMRMPRPALGLSRLAWGLRRLAWGLPRVTLRLRRLAWGLRRLGVVVSRPRGSVPRMTLGGNATGVPHPARSDSPRRQTQAFGGCGTREGDGVRPPRRRLGARASGLANHAAAGTLWAAGMASAAQRTGSLAVLALIVEGRGQADATVVALHLVAPLLATAASWPNVFYLDFKRLAEDAAGALRQRLARRLVPLASVWGALTWLAGMGLMAWQAASALPALGMALAPLMLAQSHLARVQLQDFAEARYGRVAVSFVALAAGLLVAVFGLQRLPGGSDGLDGSPVSLPLAVSAAMLVAVASIELVRTRRVAQSPHGQKRSLLAWMRALDAVSGPVRIRRALLAERHAEHARLAAWLATELGPRGAVARDGRTLFWFERADMPAANPRIERSAANPQTERSAANPQTERSAANPRAELSMGCSESAAAVLSLQRLVIAAAGMIETIVERPLAPSGRAALADARAAGLVLGSDDGSAAPTGASDIAARFRSRFPHGIVIDLADRRPSPAVAALAPEARQAVWSQAMIEARGGRARGRSNYDVTVFAPGGEIALILAVARTEPAATRAAWRRELRQASWSAALTGR